MQRSKRAAACRTPRSYDFRYLGRRLPGSTIGPMNREVCSMSVVEAVNQQRRIHALRAASLSLELPSGYPHRLDAMLIGGHLRSLTLFPSPM